jgi:predicted nuclease of predicted toxin-antitoxin system
MRFYIDEDLSDEIAAIARRLGVDAISSHERGNDGKSDDAQLALATAERRCILTNNRDHFLALAEQYAAEGRLHTGILLLSRSLPANNFVAIARALAHYAREHSDDTVHFTDWLHPASDERREPCHGNC